MTDRLAGIAVERQRVLDDLALSLAAGQAVVMQQCILAARQLLGAFERAVPRDSDGPTARHQLRARAVEQILQRLQTAVAGEVGTVADVADRNAAVLQRHADVTAADVKRADFLFARQRHERLEVRPHREAGCFPCDLARPRSSPKARRSPTKAGREARCCRHLPHLSRLLPPEVRGTLIEGPRSGAMVELMLIDSVSPFACLRCSFDHEMLKLAASVPSML